MAGHVLYGMAPCFGHTGVTFDAKYDRPGPSSLRGHLEAAQGRFWRLKALCCLKSNRKIVTQHGYTTLLLSSRIYVCVHLFGCQNKSTCFQKFKSSNVFYARAREMMPVANRLAALRRS